MTAKIYTDGDAVNPVAWQDGATSHSIPSPTVLEDWYKCKPAIRCKYFKIELSTVVATTDVEIYRLEVEYE